jgi:hypothetical protein
MLRLALLLLALLPQRSDGYTCPNFCSQRGLCGDQGVCQCPPQWRGADCSLARCPVGIAWADQATGTDVAHNAAPCSNRGACNTETGLCSCDQGFTGAACERSPFVRP